MQFVKTDGLLAALLHGVMAREEPRRRSQERSLPGDLVMFAANCWAGRGGPWWAGRRCGCGKLFINIGHKFCSGRHTMVRWSLSLVILLLSHTTAIVTAWHEN